jgi:ferredoxin
MRALAKVVNKDLEDEVFGICGGNLDCGSCLVYVPDYKTVGAPDEDESSFLKGLKEYKGGQSRCSCQMYLEKNMEGI